MACPFVEGHWGPWLLAPLLGSLIPDPFKGPLYCSIGALIDNAITIIRNPFGFGRGRGQVSGVLGKFSGQRGQPMYISIPSSSSLSSVVTDTSDTSELKCLRRSFAALPQDLQDFYHKEPSKNASSRAPQVRVGGFSWKLGRFNLP